MDFKKNTKDIDVWTRGLFIVIFAIIFYFLFILIWLLVTFQFLMKLITSKLNQPLLEFSDSLNIYVGEILNYITFKSEKRPFPFSRWPSGDSVLHDSNEALVLDDTSINEEKSSNKNGTTPDEV